MTRSNPTSNLVFRWPWRPYQQRVLDAIQEHLADRKLHVVAAPGAGKTILGLEVFRRLAQPALVLSPTCGIRDQWIARLKDFVPEASPWPPDWIGTSLDDIRFFTSITYQAVHSRQAETAEDTEDADSNWAASLFDAPTGPQCRSLAEALRAAGIRTLILDEAHHLRAEWWKALTRVLDDVPGITLVALTATPPYDVTGPEWKKYEELCGAVDEEISVPELVKVATLCPHQDYVWLVQPLPGDRDAVRQYDRTVREACSELEQDALFQQAVQQHPWLAAADPDTAAILDSPELAFALLIYLNRKGLPLPPRLLKALDTRPDDLPPLDRRWWQVLLRAYLWDESWPHDADSRRHRDQVARTLRDRALLWRHELRLLESSPILSRLSLTPSKVQACVDIHHAEHDRRGDRLRQVVLADFIGDRQPHDPPHDPARPAALAAWPAYQALVRHAPPDTAPLMALLTGRLAVVHATILPALQDLSAVTLHASDDPVMPGFVRMVDNTARLLPAFTALLARGRIRVLVGTRSLLGEGWDAPVVNSLVLASFVGSFMLTNQMRGRAIRVDRRDPDKVASVWHIAAVDPDTETGLADLEDLRRRFTTFVGLDASQPSIESGIRRLRLPFIAPGGINAAGLNIDASNAGMLNRLRNIDGLSTRWRTALETGTEGRVLPGVRMEKPPHLGPFHFRRTLRYALLEACWLGAATGSSLLRGARTDNVRDLLGLVLIAAAVGFCAALPGFIRALFLWLRHLPVDGSLRQIALSVLDGLCDADLIQTSRRRLAVVTNILPDGSWSAAITGARYFEQSLYADALEEVLAPIENPRYIITRRDNRPGIWKRMDYHAVPSLLGLNKERALLFHIIWRRRVGPGELVYTRVSENRPILLRARARAFSSAFQSRAERLDRWQ